MRYRPPRNKWGADFAEDYEKNLEDIERDITGVEEIVEGSKTNAEQALTFATEAKVQAESVQAQFNAVVVEGDSSPAADQARLDAENVLHPTLKARADSDYNKVTAQLAENQKKLSYPDKQSFLYAQFYRNLRKGNPVIIETNGDSMTYGQDTTSADIRTAPTEPLPNGSTHTFTRASVTYPEALSEYLNQVYPSQVTVINRGYSGDTTKLAYNRWITSSGANMTLMCFGINDSRAGETPGDLSVFLEYYRKLIERALDRDSAVIILSPFKMKSSIETDVDTFSNAIYALGNEYGIPVIATEGFLANYGADVYSDATHYTAKGYRIMGARIASLFVGQGAHKPTKVSDGSTLLTRPSIDNIKFGTGASIAHNAGYPTPSERALNNGIAVEMANAGEVYYSFYAESNDMVIIPGLYATDAATSFDLTLDFGIEQPDYSNDFRVGYASADFANRPASVVNLPKSAFIGKSGTVYHSSFLTSLPNPCLFIATTGWHTLKIKANKTTGATTLYGIDFYNYETLKLIAESRPISSNTKQYRVNLTEKTFRLASGTSQIAYTLGVINGYPVGVLTLRVTAGRHSSRQVVKKEINIPFGNGTTMNAISNIETPIVTQLFEYHVDGQPLVDFNFTASIVNNKLEISFTPNTSTYEMNFYVEGYMTFTYLGNTGQSVFEN